MQITVVKTNNAGRYLSNKSTNLPKFRTSIEHEAKYPQWNLTFEQDQPMYLGSTFNGSHPSDAHVTKS